MATKEVKDNLNLHEKLIEIRKSVSYLQKESTGAQYKYVSSSQVLATLRKKMDELGVLLMPSVNSAKVGEKAEDKGNGKTTITYFTELFMTMTWVNADKPEDMIDRPWYGQGVDIAGEKGVGKALTYAEKYFMLKFFNIATDKDDPDSFQKKHEENGKSKELKKPKEEPKKSKEDAQANARAFFKTFLENPKLTDDVKKYFENLKEGERFKISADNRWEIASIDAEITGFLLQETA